MKHVTVHGVEAGTPGGKSEEIKGGKSTKTKGFK